AVDPAQPARAAWKEIVPERKDATLDSATLAGGRLGLVYLKDAVTHLEVHGLDGKLVREVALPDVGTATNVVGREDEDEAYFAFESYTHPKEIFRTSMANGGAELYSRVKVPVDPSQYETEQIFATSKDGTRVPVFDDFIAAAEELVKQGFTQPSRLAIRGGSNGGLLVSAVEMQRPDLFGAVLCHVPLVDMVRYQLFGSGKTWIPEYGSADDPAQF